MNPKIEFCINNIVRGSQKAKEELEQDPDLDVFETGCRRFCGICSRHLVAVVEGKPVTANNTEELLDKVYAYIDENFD
ncbi:DUF1450 domain-containing protein [Aquibacillus sediminis]|uniref:DUF1450 domain-containing protein n=1 Tax=Aquibacillus sediminis TaxID=2574734 RepID=UPI0011085A6A|nr:DUF1450 domain-containing protein [Aquibacillus sediminis]